MKIETTKKERKIGVILGIILVGALIVYIRRQSPRFKEMQSVEPTSPSTKVLTKK